MGASASSGSQRSRSSAGSEPRTVVPRRSGMLDRFAGDRVEGDDRALHLHGVGAGRPACRRRGAQELGRHDAAGRRAERDRQPVAAVAGEHFHAQRQHLGRVLRQRRRQRARHALQRRVEAELRATVPHGDGGAVARRPGEAPAPGMDEQRAHALDGGAPLDRDLHAAVGSRAARHAHLVAEQLAAHVADLDRGFGEGNLPARALERRQPRVERDRVAGELEVAGEPALRQVLQHQLQAQPKPAAAERGHALGDAVGHALHRAGADEVEELRGRSLRGAVDERRGSGSSMLGSVTRTFASFAPRMLPLRPRMSILSRSNSRIAVDRLDARPAARVVEHAVGHPGR